MLIAMAEFGLLLHARWMVLLSSSLMMTAAVAVAEVEASAKREDAWPRLDEGPDHVRTRLGLLDQWSKHAPARGGSSHELLPAHCCPDPTM